MKFANFLEKLFNSLLTTFYECKQIHRKDARLPSFQDFKDPSYSNESDFLLQPTQELPPQDTGIEMTQARLFYYL